MQTFWSNCSIRNKLLLGIGAILAIFALSSAVVLIMMSNLGRSSDAALNHLLPSRSLARLTQLNLVDADDVGAYYVMDRNAENSAGYLSRFNADVADVRSALPQLQAATETDAERVQLRDFGTWLEEYLAADERGFALKRAGKYDAGVRAFTDFDTAKGEKLLAAVADSFTARAAQATTEVTASSHAAFMASLAGALLATLAGTVIAFALGGAISKRLKAVSRALEDVVRDDIPQLSGAMSHFAAGDLAARVVSNRPPIAVNGTDEVALLGQSYNKLVGGVNDFGGELSTTGDVLDAVIGDVKRTVDAAAGGDFSRRLDTAQHRGVFKDLGDNLNRLMDVVSQTVREIREAANVVNTSANEISSGNADLSQRTEEQASSLEETAASMEELTATVRQNADNARAASDLAISASDIAVRGGQVVGEVVQTMAAINDSGKKIVDIIAVIDGIAFQTNILALNAAVEAARAGEQGRGFAVVAGEVRTLAQRSAAAAKEIKQLIGDSVEKTDAGTRLVGRAGDTMTEIVSSVKRVTDIMSAIAEASVEQGGGIEQVNAAVAQMDQVTQQNAALVEEIAASAASLEERARALVDFVGNFKIASGEAERGSGSVEQSKKPIPAPARPAAPKPRRTVAPARAAARPQPAVPIRAAAQASDASGAIDTAEWTSF